jgi:hypothetical protein
MRIKLILILTFWVQVSFSQIELSGGPIYESFTFNEKKLNLVGGRLQFGNTLFYENMTITLAADYLKEDTLSFIAIDPTFRYYLNNQNSGCFIGVSIGLLSNIGGNLEDFFMPMKLLGGYRQLFNKIYFLEICPYFGYQNSKLTNYSAVYGANASFGILF